MKWNYFAGACVVVGGALLKAGAPVIAIAAGMALAAFANFLRCRSGSPRNPAVSKTQ